ncbi:dihydroorotate dehydrogenase [Treponema pectinovorum]|uniref:dihydroorotate dehydrogenase n=1 Tax=Treponema pectinovorum TaxID=164 RepID=UPI003D939344
MKNVKDCSGNDLPFFALASVLDSYAVQTAFPKGSIWCLKLVVKNEEKQNFGCRPGQFYMLRCRNSALLLARPISVYDCKKISDSKITLDFLILLKGQGTRELVSVRKDDKIEVLGPLGNSWQSPDENQKVALIGGGVGVAPVAAFASTLKEKSYDFYAAFKSGAYGLENIKPNKLTVTTDDGSVGIKGMITAALDVQTIKNYDVVYACGPTPMLGAIQKLCKEADAKLWVSMENRMACGVGACLGCTIFTKEGNKRCCKDGPIFDGQIIDFSKIDSPITSPKIEKRLPLKDESPDLTVNICGVEFSNPVIAASGTFGYGSEYSSVIDVDGLGGICSKGLTFEGQPGNKGIRLIETPMGLINSIGLENPGIKHFIENELPIMKKFKAKTIVNLSGKSLETYVEGAKLLEQTDIPMIELNISCPNVKAGGMTFGMDCQAASTVVKAVRSATKKPLMIKLSPNAPDLIGVAMAVKEAGADAISLINTIQATAIDIETGRPYFENIRAGFSGPAVKPIALRMVYDLCLAMNKLNANERIPVVGLGGITTWQDAVEFIMAGAAAVEVGTATFSNPKAMIEIVEGIKKFMERKGYKTLDDFRGCAL